jgi:O-antigen/teichoic acid export membrane protein
VPIARRLPEKAMSRGTITGTRAVGVGATSVYSAAVAYVVLLIAAHHLDAADNAVFLVFWAVLFTGFGIVTGVNPEAARSAHEREPDSGKSGTTILPVAVGFGTLVALVILISGWAWGGTVLPGHEGLILVAALACLAYAGHLALWGVFTGLRRWRAVAALQAGESTVRLGVVLAALELSGTLTALAVGSAVSSAAWLATTAFRSGRRYLRRRGDSSWRGQMHNFANASVASTASTALTVGFPVLMALTSSQSEILASAGLMLGISLARAPMMVPLTAFQGVALAHFLQNPTGVFRSLLRIVGVIVLVAGAGILAAWLVGAWLFRWLLGSRYALSGQVLAGLVGSAGLLAILTITGMSCLALGRHLPYAVGWLTATAVSGLLLLVPIDLSMRVLVSLSVGPLIGVTVHLLSLARTTGRLAL